jgi:acetyl-CoA carboxylase biotin carboxyl carrier protein
MAAKAGMPSSGASAASRNFAGIGAFLARAKAVTGDPTSGLLRYGGKAASAHNMTGPKRGMAKESKDKSGAETALIRELAAVLNETGLSEIEIEREGLRLRVARQVSVTALATAAPVAQALTSPTSGAPAAAGAAKAADVANHPGTVKSPMVGTAYRAAEPGSAPFVEVGTRVAQGQTLLIIEAMKTMNHIPAPRAGTVVEVFIDNGQPVEFGEPLVVIE